MGKKSAKGGISGYKYSLGMLMGLCRGPVDEVVAIKVGDLPAFDGSALDPVSGNRRIQINKPDLFGGEQKEGGVVGPIDFMFGASDQDISGTDVMNLVGNFATAAPQSGVDGFGLPLPPLTGTPQPMSFLRGVTTLFFNGTLCSNNPYPKKWTVRVRRAVKGWSGGTAWYPDEAIVALDDGGGNAIHAMNGAHILYECLTNPVWGRGLPPEALDEPSFISAANTLCREQFGLCMAWNRSVELGQFMQSVVNHIGGGLYSDRTSGLYTLKLLRKDYVESDLPVFDYSSGLLNVTEDTTTAPDNSHSEIIVNWVDPITNNARQTRVQNLAGTQAVKTVVSTKVDYPGIPTASLAARVAQRDLMIQGAGIKRFTLIFDRRGRKIAPIGVFRVNIPEHSINDMVLRAGKITEGTIDDQTLTIVALQDVFGLEATTYLGEPERAWQPPDRSLRAAEVRYVTELNYHDLVGLLPPAELATVPVDSGDISAVAMQPTSLSVSFDLQTAASGEAYALHGTNAWTPTAVLAGALDTYGTGITVVNGAGLGSVAVGGTAWLEDEIVEVTSLDASTGVAVIGRGCVDTIPAPHAAGARIWFTERGGAIDGRDFTTGETIRVKLLTRTNTSALALVDAPEDVVTIKGRQGLPYVPGDFKINTVRFADVTEALHDIVLTWAHRDRITQADHILVHEDASTGPEAGVTYTVRVYGAVSHQYWRLGAMTSATGGFLSIAEVALCEFTGGPTLTGGGTASASSTVTGTAATAFDGVKTGSNMWTAGNPNGPDWLQYDFGGSDPVNIASVVITPRADGSPEYSPNLFTLQWSDDGTTWTDVQTFTPATWVTGVDQTFNVSSSLSLARTVTGITADTWTYDATMSTADGSLPALYMELEAERDSLVSWQHYRTPILNRIPGGYGFDYGKRYGG